MIYDLAVGLRDWYSSRLLAAGRPPFEQVYVSNGSVAFDGCETLSVENDGERLGTVADQTVTLNSGSRLVVNFRVWALRCVPVVDKVHGEIVNPTAAEVEASAAAILGDRAVIMAATVALLEPGSPVQACGSVGVLGIDGVGPDGGLAGTVVRLVVAP